MTATKKIPRATRGIFLADLPSGQGEAVYYFGSRACLILSARSCR
jgi:hypothetical protein